MVIVYLLFLHLLVIYQHKNKKICHNLLILHFQELLLMIIIFNGKKKHIYLHQKLF